MSLSNIFTYEKTKNNLKTYPIRSISFLAHDSKQKKDFHGRGKWNDEIGL